MLHFAANRNKKYKLWLTQGNRAFGGEIDLVDLAQLNCSRVITKGYSH